MCTCQIVDWQTCIWIKHVSFMPRIEQRISLYIRNIYISSKNRTCKNSSWLMLVSVCVCVCVCVCAHGVCVYVLGGRDTFYIIC